MKSNIYLINSSSCSEMDENMLWFKNLKTRIMKTLAWPLCRRFMTPWKALELILRLLQMNSMILCGFVSWDTHYPLMKLIIWNFLMYWMMSSISAMTENQSGRVFNQIAHLRAPLQKKKMRNSIHLSLHRSCLRT